MKQSSVVPALSNDTASLQKGKKNLKQFLVVTALSVAIILAAWGIFKPFTSSPLATKSNNAPIPAQEEAGKMVTSVQSGGMANPGVGMEFKIAPVFGTNGAIVSDPSGTILNAHGAGGVGGVAIPMTGADFKVAPVFGANGAVISDPSGTILNAYGAGDVGGVAVPMTGADFMVAPVFGTNGAIVSDPSGTILNAHQSGGMAVPRCGLSSDGCDFQDCTVVRYGFQDCPSARYQWRGYILPTGTILNANQSEGVAVPMCGCSSDGCDFQDCTKVVHWRHFHI